jgi:tetratricopeptide (TPR) repeat protein
LQLRSAEAGQRADRPEVEVVGHELEALRIDVMQGDAEKALPGIDARLARIRGWWRSETGGSVAEAQGRTVLGRVLASGLDIAWTANFGLERWQAGLDLLDEQESVQRALGENELDLARTRFNQCGPLLRLGHLDQAQRALEGCLDIFRGAGAVADEAKCLGALADLWDERGDIGEAIALQRRALAVSNTLPNPGDRAISHGNLETYLAKAGRATEAARQHCAGLAYAIYMGRRGQAQFHNLRIRARHALAVDRRYTLPRLPILLADEEFAVLRQFLDDHQVDRTALQAELDRLVDQAHE